MRIDRVGLKLLLVSSVLILLSGCAATPESKDYSQFLTVNPRSILVVPVVNRSLEVDAPDYFLSTISFPLAEQGYYVFPVHMVKRVMEDDGLSDADMVHAVATPQLCALFGSDAVLYVTIESWGGEKNLLKSKVAVGMTYSIKDCQTGDELWKHNEMVRYSFNSPMGSLIVNILTSATNVDPTIHRPLAQVVNARAFKYPGPGIPPGPYLKKSEKEEASPEKANEPAGASPEAN